MELKFGLISDFTLLSALSVFILFYLVVLYSILTAVTQVREEQSRFVQLRAVWLDELFRGGV